MRTELPSAATAKSVSPIIGLMVFRLLVDAKDSSPRKIYTLFLLRYFISSIAVGLYSDRYF